jgi:hypothetical protein
MHKPDCSNQSKASKIKVEEKGKQAIFLNPDKSTFTRIKIDGCLVKEATACDWLVIKNNTDRVIVELKGCDVSHALDQVEATFIHLASLNLLSGRVAALIVCRRPSSHPIFTTKLQRLKDRLSKKYRAPLHVVGSNREFSIDQVLSQRMST